MTEATHDTMTDEQWLSYFSHHCRTERAGFVKSNLVKLAELSGTPPEPGLVDRCIYSRGPDAIDPLVDLARARMARKERVS